MRYESKIIPIGLFIAFMLSCGSDKSEVPPLPPPPLFNGYLCDTFKSRSRQKIYNNNIELLFDDTFRLSGKRYILDSILENRFHFSHTPIFNDDYTNCVQPIMDSAIAAKYGPNAKDSIINEAYRLTEIVYKKEYEE